MSKKKADKKKGGYVRAIRNIFVFLIACALLILLGLTGIYIYVKHDVNPRLLKEEDATALSDVDCIIILGASVKNGDTPSPMLRDRLDEGIALYKAGCAPKILMSGDHGSEYYNEVSVMRTMRSSRAFRRRIFSWIMRDFLLMRVCTVPEQSLARKKL